MAVQRKKLRVLPNPWLHIDEKGRPAGLCRLEQPGDGTFVHGWVGVTVASVTEVEAPKFITVKGRRFEQRSGIHYLTFAHADEPVTVANSQYYRKRVAAGDLIAFDEDSALACGISGRNFIKPETLLENFRLAAIAQFDAENGQGAFETLADMASEEAEGDAAVAKAVQEAKGESAEPVDNSEAATAVIVGGDAALAAKLDELGAKVQLDPPRELEGVTLPADGVARTVELTSIEGQGELPVIETDAGGNAVMAEHEAPALTSSTDTNSSRSKRNKGSEQ